MLFSMDASSDLVTLNLPRALVREIPRLSQELNDRMHALLERNTEGVLTATERAELETLVQMAQFAQLLAMATDGVRPG